MAVTDERGVTMRSVVIAALLIILTNMWVLRSELLTGSYATGGTPPAVAIGWLMALLGLGGALGKLWRRLRLSRAELMVIYASLALAIPMASYGIMRAFLPCLTVLSYFSTPQTRFDEFWEMLPDWLTVKDEELIRQCFEGAPPNQGVPWHVWAPVLARWSLFFLALFAAIMGMLSLVRHKWVEGDRLSFPILYLPMQIVGREGAGLGLFRDPVFWCGAGVALVFNLMNVLRAFNPAVPGLGTVTDLNGLLTERPWDAIRPLLWHHMPQVIGMGYLCSLEVSFSVVFFFWANKLLAVLMQIVGYEKAGAPFMMEQSSGGYLVMALVLVWMARHMLAEAAQRVWRGVSDARDRAEALPGRAAALALGGGLLAALMFLNMAGMSALLALILLLTVMCYALVYARIRAEAGVPYSQIYPADFPRRMLIQGLGARGLLAFGPERNLVLLGTMGWLSFNYYAEFMGAYQIDGLRLADEARVKRRQMASALTVAMLVGFGAAAWSHLTAYYEYGENVVDGGTGLGDHRARVAMRRYMDTETFLTNMTPPDGTYIASASAGGLITLALVVLRFTFLRFPLHPLGYLIATTYWNECPVWGSFFIVWVIKTLVLRLGGVRAYRRLIPAFLGLAIGQFFFGGIVWGNMQPFIPMEIARRYWLPRV